MDDEVVWVERAYRMLAAVGWRSPYWFIRSTFWTHERIRVLDRLAANLEVPIE